jgi:hypothetical protein
MPPFDWQSVVAMTAVALAAAWWICRLTRWVSGKHSCASGGCGHAPKSTPLIQLEQKPVGRS